MQRAPSAGTPAGDTRRGSHVRQLQLDSEEGAAKRCAVLRPEPVSLPPSAVISLRNVLARYEHV